MKCAMENIFDFFMISEIEEIEFEMSDDLQNLFI